MTLLERLNAIIFGRRTPDPVERVSLDTQQQKIAARLAKMQGSTRDEVLSEAYRRSRLTKEAESYRGRR